MPRPAQFFSQWYLEIFTRTSWYVVPIVWLPITGYIFYLSIVQQVGVDLPTALGRTMACFLVGNLIWTVSLRRSRTSADE